MTGFHGEHRSMRLRHRGGVGRGHVRAWELPLGCVCVREAGCHGFPSNMQPESPGDVSGAKRAEQGKARSLIQTEERGARGQTSQNHYIEHMSESRKRREIHGACFRVPRGLRHDSLHKPLPCLRKCLGFPSEYD
jgi:hypothetical protein